jgi:hypothetical protein
MIFSEEFNDRMDNTKLETGNRNKNASNLFDFSLNASVYGGGMFGYQSLDVDSPVTGLNLKALFNINLPKTWYLTVIDKVEAEKAFEGAQNTAYTLDSLKNNAKIKFGFDNDKVDISANMNWAWQYRPQWPDLYQPNPLRYVDTLDPAFDDYMPTDRNSYNKFEPELSFDFSGVKNLGIRFNTSFVRYIEEEDPNFDPAVPTHLTPSTYSGYSGDLKLSYKFSKVFSLELANKAEFREYDNELARDSTTGKTHYSTQPNPNYTEFNNKITLAPEIKISSISLTIKPFFALDINEDLFEGYYSYTGYEPGIEIEQKIGKFKYIIGFSYDMQEFGPDSFDPVTVYDQNTGAISDYGTTDGETLYKHYTKANLELEYRINNSFEIFIEGKMVLKTTNYPDYIPGANPSSKNYSIDFNYENYYIRSGVTYKL